MSKTQQDQFIDDDEEETCPLCVEELDLTDKGFRPCPCGYQICQFCYNNVKNNMNGLCPACRRPYNDDDIIYKSFTPEEQAAHKARQAQKQKKTQAALQKEKQKAEADSLSRKHLAGLRVVQKNLVYVTGLSPNFQEDKLLQTLRGNEYFGQYGKIIKIVVSKAKDVSHPQSVGVYVTYERKEDAATCIAAVNGVQNGDRTLRAQFGTTKYCSAYLRGEICTNRQCMFLHEAGEANESYSRADLSAMNAGGSQSGPSRQPPPQSQQPVASASASQPMARQSSSDRPESPAVERPALPSTASWAARPPHYLPIRSESRSTSGTMDSPALVHATPAQAAPEPAQEQAAQPPPVTEADAPPPSTIQRPRRPRETSPLVLLLKNFNIDDLKFAFSGDSVSQPDLDLIDNYPPLFDKNGGARRRLRRQREEEQRRVEEATQQFQQPLGLEQDETDRLGGSLQLGGEPEDRGTLSQPTSAIQPPGQDGLLDQRFQFGAVSSPGLGDRGLTPEQQQQLLLMKGQGGQGSYLNNGQASSFQQPGGPPGHQRNASRYSFANETSASTSVKPVANAKLLNQQSSIMPPTGSNHFGAQQQPHGSQFYTSNVQGPPPGLKTTGTPPVSGGMTFGQGHGFATGGLQYGTNTTGRNANEEMMRNLLRTRGEGDASKHDADFPPLAAPPSRQTSISLGRSTPPVPPGFEGHAHSRAGSESRRSTPTAPPGLTKPPTAVPTDLDGLGAVGSSSSGSRPGSRASLKRLVGQAVAVPAIPLRPATPLRTATPAASPKLEVKREEMETPTRAPKGKESVISADAKDEKSETSAKTVVEGRTDQKEEIVMAAGAETGLGTEKTLIEHVVAPKPSSSVAAPPDNEASKLPALVPVSQQTNSELPPTKHQPSALPASAPMPTQKSAPKGMQPSAKGQATVQASSAKAAPVTPSKPEPSKNDPQQRRKQPPGKLDIAAAVQHDNKAISSPKPSASATQNKDVQTVASSPATSKAESPGVASPAVKTAPKTLRVVATPKTEAPPVGATTPGKEPVSAVPPSARQPSRQPSVASISLPPGTPSSEQVSISDTVSMTSASVSRANSPPPPTAPAAGSSKAGSAPARPKTKTQLKKERQERAKAIEEEKVNTTEDEPKSVIEEPAQEAIVSRKKKTKKEKEPKPPKAKPPTPVATTAPPTPKEDSTPTASRPATPQQADTPPAAPKAEQVAKESNASKPSTPTNTQSAPTPLVQSPGEPSPPATPTIAQLIAGLKATTPEIQKCIDSLFRSPTSNHYKPNQPITAKDIANFKLDFKLNLTEKEVGELQYGDIEALRYGGQDGRIWDRGMVTPGGAHLRALTVELEKRFLELERAIDELPRDLSFRPSKPQNETKFPSIDLEALRRQFENVGGRGVSVMEAMVQDGSTMKKGAFLVDEASRYINEFVMPPATPPPSAGGGVTAGGITGGGKVSQMQPGVVGEGVLSSVNPDIAERQLQEARRVAEERDVALKKAMKKNRRALGLG